MTNIENQQQVNTNKMMMVGTLRDGTMMKAL